MPYAFMIRRHNKDVQIGPATRNSPDTGSEEALFGGLLPWECEELASADYNLLNFWYFATSIKTLTHEVRIPI